MRGERYRTALLMTAAIASALSCLKAPEPDAEPKPKPYPWAVVPQTTVDGEPCEQAPSQLTACSFARKFDALIIFDVDELERVETPVFLSGNEVPVEQCATVRDGAWLLGETIAATDGASPTRIFAPGGPHDGIVFEKRRVFLRVAKKEQTYFVIGNPLAVSEDGRLLEADPSECFPTSTLDGRAVLDVVEEVGTCTEIGSGLTEYFLNLMNVGAICYSDTVVPECSSDNDCPEPGQRCVDSSCIAS